MTPKEYLSRYRRLKNEIDAKLAQVEELEALAEKISPSLSGTSGGQVSDKVGRTAAKILDLRNEIDEDISRMRVILKDIKAAIDSVSDGTLRMLLIYRYINGFTWERIAEEMDYTYRWVCILHGRALKKIPKKFYDNSL